MTISRPVRLLLVSAVAVMMLTGLVGLAVRGPGIRGDDLALVPAALIVLAVGALVVLRVPENRVSWVLLAVAFGFGLMGVGEAVFGLSEVGEDPTFGDVLTGIALFSLVLPGLSVFVPLWFPTGEAPSPRWRWVGWLALAGVVAINGGVAVVGLVEDGDINSIGACFSVGTCSSIGGLIALLVAAVAAVISFVVRWIRSEGVERLQLRWLVPAFIVFGIGVVAEFGGFPDSPVANIFLAVGLMLVPVTIAIAILRYRLYEIDRIISRTVGYALMVAFLAALYGLVVVGIPTVLPAVEDSELLVAAATLAAFFLFNPLRRRVLRAVDRRFYRSRYDAQRVVEEFSERLRDEVDLDELTSDWLSVVQQTVQPASMSVWVRGER